MESSLNKHNYKNQNTQVIKNGISLIQNDKIISDNNLLIKYAEDGSILIPFGYNLD